MNIELENDCFLPDKSLGKGDHDYSHGTCFEYITDSLIHIKFGQNMYTPSDLRAEEHIPGDRPYAGFLYGGFGYEFLKGYVPFWTHYGELDLGVIGPAAFAGHTQKFIHKILNCKDPKGWHNQLNNEFVVNAQWWTKYNYYACRWIAVVPRVGALAGTVEDAVEAGCDVKIGWNLMNDIGNNIMFSASSRSSHSWIDDLQAYVYAGVDERLYLYNHILQGSFIQDKDRKQGLDVDIERFVGEIQAGACFRFKQFIAKYYMIFRQNEFKHQKHSPNYAGLTFGWCW